ncbi:MAG: DUF1015 domain-containing protein [Bacteroidetes bacterium]|nr:DUF1015 domain-containing protein [Bacteroidota bacterium]
MAIIKAFKAFRPEKSIAEQLASFPYDVLNSEEARELAKDNPYSFLRINKPEVDLDPAINVYDASVYAKGKENLDSFIDRAWLAQDANPLLYIYAQRMGNHLQKGLVACCSIDDYLNDVIKKHEHTRPVKENDRIDHMYTAGANLGPVFLAYKPLKQVDQIIEEWTTKNKPENQFISSDGIEHITWLITDETTIKQLTSIFETQVKYTYVADGHHRSAASAKVGLKMREENPEFTGREDFNYFLSVLFPADQLMIIDYNRVIKNLLPDISTEEFLTALLSNFTVEAVQGQVRPSVPGEFGLYIDKQWYRLTADDSIKNTKDPIESLDISILSNYVIDPLLGIEDQRTDDRIDFIGGIRGLDELERRVDSGEMRLAFAIPPVTMEQLMRVADSGKVMPPKSTWFEPKLRSGLFVHKFK